MQFTRTLGSRPRAPGGVALAALAAAVLVAAPGPAARAAEGDDVLYVSDEGDGVQGRWENWDVWSVNRATGARTRLTTNPAIDNHPESNDEGWIVWSSNRGNGDFDIYLATSPADVEGSALRLTDDARPGDAVRYPDRHPHFHPDGRTIIHTAKNRKVFGPTAVASECSVPKIVYLWRDYEGCEIVRVDGTGTVVLSKSLDVRDAWDAMTSPGIWIPTEATYVGHPSFSHDGTKVVFSASIDADAKVWEVYTAGWDNTTASFLPNSLRRATNGPDTLSPNPIKMSGGAHFSDDDATIFFSSTRTAWGNSLIFSVPATADSVPVTSASQITVHGGNDYVPEPLPDGSVVITTDLGPALCGEGESASDDLDVVLCEEDGHRRDVIADDENDETLLLADEVSWFCGVKPNLTSCTSTPRIFPLEGLWLEWSAWLFDTKVRPSTPIPDGLLQGYGYATGAVKTYAEGWANMDAVMTRESSHWDQVKTEMLQLDLMGAAVPGSSGFPGLADETALGAWMTMTAPLRGNKHVVPSVMYGTRGIGIPSGLLPDLTGAFTSWRARWSGRGKARRLVLTGRFRAVNVGTARAPAATVTICASERSTARAGDRTVGRLRIPALSPGRSRTLRWTRTLPARNAPAGGYVHAAIDPLNAVHELVESNNGSLRGPLPE